MESNAQAIIKNIIVCIDGEKWTEKAITYAMEITRAFNGKLTALHVINPYLKKFADEIYAVGRIEYCNYIDKELRKEAENIISGFKAMANSIGLPYNVIVRYGPPEEEIIKETLENAYDLLVLGAKPLNAFKNRIGSFNLPMKIFKNIQIPAIFVR
ncbi:MAG TPA: universal stress protein [Thermodesulfovibrionales bacterium]|nr:universal stress protein [Thermodesulfovibrionales bacterium]